ncbi:hypothetical protein MMC21_006524 [Puttea exsequens]|nr:hypothetical protein [Puttea exsequens]
MLLLTINLPRGSPAFNENSPHATENFDPAEANPKGNITCLGDSYDVELPAQPHFNPNVVTMQQLCAKPQYGGGSRGQHLGGWCYIPGRPASSPQGYFEGIVAFDRSIGAEPIHALQTPRVLLGCYYKCFCNYGVDDRSVQPKTTRATPGLFASRRTWEVKIDVVDDFTVPAAQHLGTRGAAGVFADVFNASNEVGSYFGYRITREYHISMDWDNKITCHGALPPFEILPPYRISHFENLQMLCSVVMGGGNS